MKRILQTPPMIAGMLLLALTMATASGCRTHESEQTTSNAQMTQYTCPMHPEVVQDHPGKCPKCGMDLVVKR